MRLKENIKRTIALFLIAASASGAPLADEFCDGYREGFKAGYEQVTNYGTPPRIMTCPRERHRDASDRRPDFQRGYDAGVKDGIRLGSRGE